MAVDDVLDDREAKAGAAHLARAGGVDSVEALGEARQVLARNAVAPIAYRNRDRRRCRAVGLHPAGTLGDHGDLGPRPAVFDGVVEEVLKQLGQFVAIAQDIGQIVGHGQRDPHAATAGAQRQRLGEIGEERSQRHPRPWHHMLVELDPRQGQEILDEPRHASRLLVHDGKKPLARFGIVARRPEQGVDEAGERRQRGAQFMARIGDEIGPHLLGALEFGNVVQGQSRNGAVE